MQTRELVEGALMSALIAVIMLLDTQTGGLFREFFFLLPLPFVYFSYKYKFTDSFIVLFSCLILTLLVANPVLVFYCLMEGLIGMVIGNGLKKKLDYFKLIFQTISLSIIITVLTFILFSSFFGYDISNDIQVMKDVVKLVNDGYEGKLNYEVTFYVIILITGAVQGFLTLYFSRMLLLRLKFPIDKPRHLIEFKPPVISGYSAIVFGGAYFYLAKYGIDNQYLNALVTVFGVLGIVYLTLFGMITLTVLINLFIPGNRFLKLIILVFAYVSLSVFVLIIGFLYITTGLRKKLLERILNAS